MNCQEVMEFMQRQLDGDLDAKEEDELHAHLMHCLDCAQMFERLQRLSDELTQLPRVIPPYSLVDAIMPQLNEIDIRSAASITDNAAFSANTTQITHGQPPKLPWTRRFGSQFSWKFAGGVVAAGLVLGFFAFNLQQPVLEQADSLLAPRAEQPSAGQMRSTNASDSNIGQQADTMKKVDSPDAKQEALNPPTADAKGLQENVVPQEAGGEGLTPQDTTDAKLEKPKVISPSNTAKDSDASRLAPSTSDPERMKEPTAFGASGKKDPDSSLHSPDAGTSNKLRAGTPTVTTTAPTPTAKQESDAAGGFQAFTSQVSAQSLQSATGVHEAVIEDQHVVIRNSATKEIVFASKQVWKPADLITLVEWSKDDKLFYQVESEGSLHTFLIDLTAKTEAAK